jgi:hypothetical protein
MKYINLLFIIILFFSCNHQSNTQNSQTTVVNSQTNNSGFNWSKSKTLKQKMLNDLKLKNKSNDEIIVEFLKEYGKLEAEFNEILFARPDLDSLYALIDPQAGKVSPDAKKFKKEVEDGGFKLASSEGMIYIAQSSAFIKSATIDLLDPVSVEFLNLYCNEIDTVCCEDAGLSISTETLVNRILMWGNLMDKVKDLKYNEIVDSEFYANLQLLFLGLDNTPSFDFETGKFDMELLDKMNEIIKRYPNSKATNEFKVFIKVLVSENYKKTDKIFEFINKRYEFNSNN